MATFVGAEYIIANVLIALKKFNKKDTITLDELSEAGIYIQKHSLSNNEIDAIFLSSSKQVVTALYDFSDYFEYDRENGSIRIVKTKKYKRFRKPFYWIFTF